MAKDIKFNIKLNIDGKNVIVQASESVKELQRNLTAAKTGSQRLSAALIKVNQTTQAYTNISGALSTLGGIMNGYIAKANSAAEAQTKLSTIMRQRMSATDADTAAINNAVAAQTKLGIVSGTVQKSGLQQLATFASQRQTLETLLPAMNNLLAQQKGLNATSEDAVGVANLMGKALQGNVGALTRVGVTLSDHQKELIKTGDEYTRATTLAQAITDNVGNMNAELAKTDAGQVKKAQMAFASLQVTIGKAIAPYQELITMFGQVGFAVSGVAQLLSALRGLVVATGTASLASSIWHARMVMSTAVTNLFSAALNGASVGATTLKFALRGLMSATVVGAATTLLGIGLEKLISYFTSASDASGKLKQSVESTGDSFKSQRDQALAPTLTKYQELQAKWKTLKSTHEKNEFVKANKTAFEQLGVSIDGVGQAEDFFVRNTKAVQDAMFARAAAAAAAALAEKSMTKVLLARDKVKADRAKDVDSYKKQHHNGKTGHDAASDALIDAQVKNGQLKLTSGRTRKHQAELRQAEAKTKEWTYIGINATNRANKGQRPYQDTTTVPTGGGNGRSTGSGGTSYDASETDKKAVLGSLDWYDQKMQELRKKIYATSNEETAQGLQAQYDDLAQKAKDLKVKIGLEEPDAKEVKTYMEKLQDKLAAAQKEMENATTIEARVQASAKVDRIQAEIDTATKGELTIKADVEPTYVRRGSLADKRQSYHNAQGKASRIQEDFEIGIIGKEEAEKQIAEVNKEIEALGKNLKPLKLEVDNKSLDTLRSLSNVDLTNFESVQNAIGGINQMAGGTSKTLGAAGAACAALGSSMQQLGQDSAVAKTGMILGAIGQIVLSYAQAMASTKSWVTWLAFGLTGAAQLAGIINTVKGFATGGIVGGSSTTGDKVPIRVNSGEMILTKSQQARLFSMANGQLTPSVNIPDTISPRVSPSFRAPASEGSDKIEFVLHGDTATAQISNHSRLMKKIGRTFEL